MTGTDAISKSITLTKGTKTATITITDSNGNGIFDSNDKFKVSGDKSVFTSQDIKNAVTGYQVQAKTDGGAAEVAKDANGKITIEDKEYRLGSLADSLFATDKTNATAPATSGTTTFTDPNAAYNASVAALGAKYQQITDTWKSTISNIGVCSLMSGDSTQYYQATQAYMSVLLSSLNMGGKSTPAPASAPATAPAAPVTSAVTAPNDQIFADDTKADAKANSGSEAKEKDNAETKVKADADTKVKAGTDAKDKRSSETKALAQQMTELRKQAQSLGLTLDPHDNDPKNFNSLKARIEKAAAVVAVRAKDKEDQVSRTIDTLNKALDNYEAAVKAGNVGIQKNNQVFINEKRDVLTGFLVELGKLEPSQSEAITDKLNAINKRLANVPTKAEQDDLDKKAKYQAQEEAKKAILRPIKKSIDGYLNGSYRGWYDTYSNPEKAKIQESKTIELIDAMNNAIDGKMSTQAGWLPEKTDLLDKYLKALAKLEPSCSKELKDKLDAFNAKLDNLIVDPSFKTNKALKETPLSIKK